MFAEKQDPGFKRLTEADLAKLRGAWELKVDTKAGWKGSIWLHIIVAAPGHEREGFGFLVYDAELIGPERVFLRNSGGMGFAGVRKGDAWALVAGGRPPFEVKPTAELMAPFTVANKKLTLDLSRSRSRFWPKKLPELDLDWSKLEWTASDRKRQDK